MKMYYAKIAVFVDDEVCDKDITELIPLLCTKVNFNSKYLENEFGIAVRPLWTSLEDVSKSVTPEQQQVIDKIIKS